MQLLFRAHTNETFTRFIPPTPFKYVIFNACALKCLTNNLHGVY